MKTKLTTLILTLATAFGFAQAPSKETIPNIGKLDIAQRRPKVTQKATDGKSFMYLRMGISDTNLRKVDTEMVPGLGLGYRLISGPSAMDLSISYNQREDRKDAMTKKRSYYYTLPKANYIHYITPKASSSLYAGGGLAWGGVKNAEQEFVGLVPNIALGFEMNRKAAWRSFVQLDVSKPAVAAKQIGTLPNTFAELTLGAGF